MLHAVQLIRTFIILLLNVRSYDWWHSHYQQHTKKWILPISAYYRKINIRAESQRRSWPQTCVFWVSRCRPSSSYRTRRAQRDKEVSLCLKVNDVIYNVNFILLIISWWQYMKRKLCCWVNTLNTVYVITLWQVTVISSSTVFHYLQVSDKIKGASFVTYFPRKILHIFFS